MKRIFKLTTLALACALMLAGAAAADDDPFPTDLHTRFYNSNSTFLGEPLPVGSIIKAYDPDGVWCGVDTVTIAGQYGYMAVYGDSPYFAGDQGAETNDSITFTVNGLEADYVGDPIWVDQTSQDLQLIVSSATVDLSLVAAPESVWVHPGDTAVVRVDVSNDGDAMDFYDVTLSLSPSGGTSQWDWEGLEPDSLVYADPAEIVSVYFSVRTPVFHADTVNAVSYTIFSGLDPLVSIDSLVYVIMTVDSIPVGVDEPNPDNLPGSFTLFQNYPNPFNPTTVISFDLPTISEVRLSVIDMLGRTVDERDLGQLAVGLHEVEFDASALASGVYFYRIETTTAAISKKMILVK